MKKKNTSTVLASGFAAVALIGSGCATVQSAFESNTPREEVTESIDSTAAMVAEVNGHIDGAVRQLQDIFEHPSADLSRQLSEYSDSVDRLDNAFDRLKSRNENVQQTGREYLVEWNQEIATIRDNDLREQSLERREEVAERLEALDSSFATVRERVEELRHYLADVQSALTVDLTGPGVDQVRSSVDNIDSIANPAREALQEHGEELRQTSIILVDSGLSARARS